MNKKKRTIIAALLSLALIGGLATMAYLIDKEGWLTNEFLKGKKYTLTYHANTGDPAEDEKVKNIPDQQKEYGDGNTDIDFTVSTAKPTRSGMVFMGWFDTSTPTFDDIKYGEGGENTYTADKQQYKSNLYAKWEAGYTLIYDANGGANAPAPQTQVSGDSTCTFSNLAEQGAMTGPPEADGTDDHRVFLGWSENKNATEPTYTKDGKLAYPNTAGDYDKTKVDGFETQITINAAETPSKTKTLYAVWATKYELNYSLHPELTDPASHGPVPDTQTWVTKDKTHTFHIPERVDKETALATGKKENAPTRDEDYYWGWWGDTLDRFGYLENTTDEKVNEGCYKFDEDVAPLKDDKPVLTLYAYFQPPQGCLISFDEGDFKKTRPDDIDRERARTKNMPFDMGASMTGKTWEATLPDNIPTHPEWDFLGWSEDKDATSPTYAPSSTIIVNKIVKNNVKLYAVWRSKHKFRVRFNVNNDGGYSGTATTWAINNKKTKPGWDYWGASSTTCWFEAEETGKHETQSEYYSKSEYPSYTFDAEFFKTRGAYATRTDDPKGTYTFYGWSRKPVATSTSVTQEDADYPVTVPADPQNVQEGEGVITDDVVVEESDPECVLPTTHELVLYAVWRRSPKHSFELKFDKGGDNKVTITGTSTFTSPSLASMDNPDYTWTKDANGTWNGWDITSTPIATKADEDGATYEFIGWYYEKDGTEVDISIDPTTKRINQDITVEEPATSQADCEGGKHTITIKPRFQKKLRHKFNLYFEANAPSTSPSLTTTIYEKKDGAWTKPTLASFSNVYDINYDTNKIAHRGTKSTVKTVYKDLDGSADNKSQTWTFDATNSLYASCEDTSPTGTQKFKFLGWSYTKYSLTGDNRYDPETDTIEFPVEAPANPEMPQGNQGVMSGSVTINEGDVTYNYCSDDAGQVHNRVLYGVWEGEPLHQFSVIFSGNGKNSKVNYRTGEPGDRKWAQASTTIRKPTSPTNDPDNVADLNLQANLENCWRLYSPPLKMGAAGSADDSKTYVWDKNDWKGDPEVPASEIGVNAVRTADENYEYEFVGWSYDPDTDPDDLDSILEVDENGYIKAEDKPNISATISITDDDYPCDMKTHNKVLYAIWKPHKRHNYQLIFYGEGKSGTVKWKNGNSWSNGSDTVYKTSFTDIDWPFGTSNSVYYNKAITTPIVKTADDVGYYEWKAEDKVLAVKAQKDPTATTRYIFKGWAESPNQTVAKYTVDDDGYLEQDVKIEDPDFPDCEFATHHKVLYPVWEEKKVHSFTLNINLNSGSGDYSSSSYLRSYNSSTGKWADGGKMTYKEPETGSVDVSDSGNEKKWAKEFWSNTGVGARKAQSAKFTYEFMGWSDVQVPISPNVTAADANIQWKKDSSSTEAGDGFIDQDISVNCSADPCEGGAHSKTIYAVWKAVPRTKEYKLSFDGNGTDVTGVPGEITDNEVYKISEPNSWNQHTFTIPRAVPVNNQMVFVGWADDKDAKFGRYGYPNETNQEIYKVTKNLREGYTALMDPTSAYSISKQLYAIWWYEYDLDYKSNGGSNAPPLDHAYTSETSFTFTISDQIPTRPGHKFLGWSTSENGPVEYEASTSERKVTMTLNADPGGKKVVRLYAVWQAE